MKRLLILSVLAMVIGFSGLAQASLYTWEKQGEKVVYDSDADMYWVWDLTAATNMTYDEQIMYADQYLNIGSGYFGLYDWHMASLSEMQSLWQYHAYEISTSFEPSEVDQNDVSWWGRYDLEVQPHPTLGTAHYWAWTESTVIGLYDKYPLHTDYGFDIFIASGLGAWYVTSAITQYTHTPVPPSVLLLASGLVGLGCWRNEWLRRIRRRRLG